MATGNLNIAATIQGDAAGSWAFTSSYPVPTTVQGETIVTLTNGSTTVTVPSAASVAVIVPPNSAYPQPNPNWSGTLTLKGVSGDTGVPISTKYPTPISWDTATTPASFVLTATAAGTCYVRFM